MYKFADREYLDSLTDNQFKEVCDSVEEAQGMYFAEHSLNDLSGFYEQLKREGNYFLSTLGNYEKVDSSKLFVKWDVVYWSMISYYVRQEGVDFELNRHFEIVIDEFKSSFPLVMKQIESFYLFVCEYTASLGKKQLIRLEKSVLDELTLMKAEVNNAVSDVLNCQTVQFDVSPVSGNAVEDEDEDEEILVSEIQTERVVDVLDGVDGNYAFCLDLVKDFIETRKSVLEGFLERPQYNYTFLVLLNDLASCFGRNEDDYKDNLLIIELFCRDLLTEERVLKLGEDGLEMVLSSILQCYEFYASDLQDLFAEFRDFEFGVDQSVNLHSIVISNNRPVSIHEIKCFVKALDGSLTTNNNGKGEVVLEFSGKYGKFNVCKSVTTLGGDLYLKLFWDNLVKCLKSIGVYELSESDYARLEVAFGEIGSDIHFNSCRN